MFAVAEKAERLTALHSMVCEVKILVLFGAEEQHERLETRCRRDINNFVEFGWVRISSTLENQCGATGGDQPWRLTTLRVAGHDYCPEGNGDAPQLDDGVDRDFTIQNLDADGHFEFYFDGNFIVENAVDAVWASGTNYANGERIKCSNSGCNKDSAWSRFNGLDYENGSGWHNWNTADTCCLADDDPDFYGHNATGYTDWWYVDRV